MSRLLVSVRNVQEAEIAFSRGVDLIDVKDPSRGSLGAADFTVVRDVIRTVAGRVPVSMALGELVQWDPAHATRIPAALAYVKWGMSGAAGTEGWPSLWRAAAAALPGGVRPVAVVYADRNTAGSPPPLEIVAEAGRLGCPYLLVDTFFKSAGSLLDHLSLSQLADLVRAAREHRLGVALAGSLSEEAIARVLAIDPDFIAVRGAVCRNGRTGPLEAWRVERMVRLLKRDC